MTWTPERVAAFKRYFDEGMSFGLIVGKMPEFTRNSLIGKAHREGWPRRVPTKTAPRIGARARFKYKSPPPVKIVRQPEPPREAMADGSLPGLPIAAPVIVGTDHFCLLENLTEHSCRWPCWDDGTPAHEKFFCGSPTANLYEGRPYCSHHHAWAFTSAPRKARTYYYNNGRAA